MESGCSDNSPECICPCGCGCQNDPNGQCLPFKDGMCADCTRGRHEVAPVPMDYPKIVNLTIELDPEHPLTLDQMLEQVRASYFYAVEHRQHYQNPLEVNAPCFDGDYGECGWWNITLNDKE